MPMGLPAGVVPGQIYRHDRFYKNENGEWQTKYLLVLTGSPDGDVVFRLLTSRATADQKIHGAITVVPSRFLPGLPG